MRKTRAVLIAVFLLSICAGLSFSAYAGTNHSQSEAVAWIRAQEGSTYAGDFGYQCVDLVRAYYSYLGQAAPYGNANAYLSGSAQFTPDGWTAHYGTNGIQPGDITVWTGGENGHVALVVEVGASSCTVMQQNGDGNGHLRTEASKGHYGTQYFSGITGYIHPDFAPSMAPMDVNFYVNGRDTEKITGIGNIQVYVDGQLQTTEGASSYVDFCQHVPSGKPYEVKVNITNSDYKLIGVDTSEAGYTGQTGTTSNTMTKVRLVFWKMAPMDVNFTVDGEETSKLTGIGNIQVYVGGELQKTLDATSYVDFCQHVFVGKPYEVKVNVTNSDYRFIGVDTSASGYSGQTGTTGENNTFVRLVFCKMAPMDVNFTVDGKDTSKLTGIGNIQVYVDGELQKTLDATSYVDFYQHVFVGKPYEVKLNLTNSNYRFVGVDTSEAGYTGQTGTTGKNGTKVRLVLETVQNSGGGNQTGGNGQTGNGQQANGSQTATNATSTNKKEPITIKKTPTSVKAKAKKGKVTVSWKKIKKTKKTKALLKQIKGIQIQYSTDPKFENKAATKIKQVGKKKTKVTLKLKRKTKYYIRVRYIGSDGVSKWSKVKKVKTK